MSKDMPERTSEDMPERMSNIMSENMTNVRKNVRRYARKMSEDMPERTSEDMPERMATIHAKKNVQIGMSWWGPLEVKLQQYLLDMFLRTQGCTVQLRTAFVPPDIPRERCMANRSFMAFVG